MYTLSLSLATAVVLMAGAANSNDSCASFTANTCTVPVSEGYTATLTFTINNNCTGEESWVKRVSVYKDHRNTLRAPDCQVVHTNKTTLLPGQRCPYDPKTFSGSFTHHVKGFEDQEWGLFGELKDGRLLNTTVQISSAGAPFTIHTSAVLVLNGYNATLVFRVNNTCVVDENLLVAAAVYTGSLGSLAPLESCQVTYNASHHPTVWGCTYDPETLTGSLTEHIEGYLSVQWTLTGTFENGEEFTTMVLINPPRRHEVTGLPMIILITASVPVGAVFTVVIIVVVVICLRRKTQSSTPGASSCQPALEEDCYYLHPVSPPAGPTQPPAKVSGQQQALRRQADENHYGYSIPNDP